MMGSSVSRAHASSAGTIDASMRQARHGHPGSVVWFTGLSGAGKSTLAYTLEAELFDRQMLVYVLDGDKVRGGLNRDLGFSVNDRQENIRRLGEAAKLLADAGLIVLVAAISPFRADRQLVRELIGPEEFIEVYVRCPLESCERRDVKGLYQQARSGRIPNFTGISSPYEVPEHPDLVIETDKLTVEQSLNLLLTCLAERNLLRSEGQA